MPEQSTRWSQVSSSSQQTPIGTHPHEAEVWQQEAEQRKRALTYRLYYLTLAMAASAVVGALVRIAYDLLRD